MRSSFARLFLTGVVGVAVAGCSASSGPPPSGGLPNIGGGAPGGQGGGGLVSNQGPPGGFAPSFLIDGGVVSATSTYTGYNTSGVKDVQSAADAGTDVATKGSSAPPANPAGSHAISFNGNNKTQILLSYNGTVGKATGQNGLLIPVLTTGQIQPINYGAIVLFATVTPSSLIPPSASAPTLAVELVGGSGGSLYDVRAGCATSGELVGSTTFERYVCGLPAYGAASGSYSTKFSSGEFSFSSTAGTLQNSASGGAAGTFTPSASEAPSVYIVLNYPSLTNALSIGNQLSLDYIYAEQGTQ